MDLHEQQSKGVPDNFSQPADYAYSHTDGRCQSEHCHGKGVTALTGTELHRDEAQNIGEQRREGEYQETMEEEQQMTTQSCS